MEKRGPPPHKHGSIYHRLQRQLRGWTKSDGPPKCLKPINIRLIHHTFAALHRQNNNKSNCLKWIIYVPVFFLNCPGECSMTQVIPTHSGGATYSFIWDSSSWMCLGPRHPSCVRRLVRYDVHCAEERVTRRNCGTRSKRLPPCLPCRGFGRAPLIATQAWSYP